MFFFLIFTCVRNLMFVHIGLLGKSFAARLTLEWFFSYGNNKTKEFNHKFSIHIYLCELNSDAVDSPFGWSFFGTFRKRIVCDQNGSSGAYRDCPGTNSCCGIRSTESVRLSMQTSDGLWCEPLNLPQYGSTFGEETYFVLFLLKL